MYQDVFRLLALGDPDPEGLLSAFARLCRDMDAEKAGKEEVSYRFSCLVRRLLDLAEGRGLSGNLWQGAVACYLVYGQSPYALAAERRGSPGGTLEALALADCARLRRLMAFDFAGLARDLELPAAGALTRYLPGSREDREPGAESPIEGLTRRLAAAPDEASFLTCLTGFYRDFGVGDLGLYRSFRVAAEPKLRLVPVTRPDGARLEDLVGCESQKRQLLANTEAFLRGLPANNCLLYGDSGTGKSTCVRALANRFYPRGLRLVELGKGQLPLLPQVIALMKNRPYRFVIFLDDLSFEDSETEYKSLKAAIEGGLESRPDNVLLLATSNRRHLVKEVFTDRQDMEYNEDVHRSDTLEEKLSLAGRFGLTIRFSSPDRTEFFAIVRALAQRAGISGLSEQQLLAQANVWERRRGGPSGRTARQFVDHLAGSLPRDGQAT